MPALKPLDSLSESDGRALRRSIRKLIAANSSAVELRIRPRQVSAIMSYNTIQLAYDGGVATITLNRPEKRNAISFELIDDLLRAPSMKSRNPMRSS